MPDAQVTSGLWESILKDVHTETRIPDKTVLLLGRPAIGKRTLVQALLAHACPAAAADAGADISPEGHSRAVGLDYAYFGGRDPDQDEAASAPDYLCPSACSVLILEDVRHEKILRSRLTADGFKHCAAVICLDFKAPWTMMEDLRQWLELLQRLTSELLQQLPLGEQDQLRERIAAAVSNYEEQGADNAAEGRGDAERQGAAVVYNLGIPLIVVVTRADGASALETQKTVGWAETIEVHLRNECLPYGAALVYTMVQAKNTRNVGVLYDYLMHRLYAYTLRQKPQVPSRDALFVPSGWDTQAKVDAAAAQLPGGGGLDRSFESVVVSMERPPAPPPAPEDCEDMQHFLKRNAVVLQKLGGVSAASARKAAAGKDPARATSPDESKRDLTTTTSVATSRRSSVGKPDAAGGTVPPATDNSSLANFFQNLLTRGQGGAPGAATTGARAPVGSTAGAPVPAAAAPAAPPAAVHAATGAPAVSPVVSIQLPEKPGEGGST